MSTGSSFNGERNETLLPNKLAASNGGGIAFGSIPYTT